MEGTGPGTDMQGILHLHFELEQCSLQRGQVCVKPFKASGQYTLPGVYCTQLCTLRLCLSAAAKLPQITPRVVMDHLQAR